METSVELESGRIESGFLMKRFVEGEDRRQGVLLPEHLDGFVAEENQVRVIHAFVDELDLRARGFEGVVAETTGRPACDLRSPGRRTFGTIQP